MRYPFARSGALLSHFHYSIPPLVGDCGRLGGALNTRLELRIYVVEEPIENDFAEPHYV
jgi:hypothetical protein